MNARSSKKQTNARSVTDIDRAVGVQIKVARKLRGLSQMRLGNKIGVQFQQIQKHENGSNRVPASRLYAIATALDLPLIYFFPSASEETEQGQFFQPLTNLKLEDARDVLKALDQSDEDTRRNFVELIGRVATKK